MARGNSRVFSCSLSITPKIIAKSRFGDLFIGIAQLDSIKAIVGAVGEPPPPRNSYLECILLDVIG
jgi:hypothetical protein